ncbi:diguanylate cyclase domain-containing protein [Terriglobus sp. RCC_193]|uniref:GGDEF domain-containing protein n=1 Tax=Terriglobus sp. RCC_193 TaxID=3239218 RepID=UPI003526398E
MVPTQARPVRPLSSAGLAISLFFAAFLPLFAQLITGIDWLMPLLPSLASCMAAITCIVMVRSHWGLSGARWHYLSLHFLFRGAATVLDLPGIATFAPVPAIGWLKAGFYAVAVFFLLLSLISLQTRRNLALRTVDVSTILLLTLMTLPAGQKLVTENHGLRAPVLLLFFLCLAAGASYLSSASRSNVQFSGLVTRYLLVALAARSIATIEANSRLALILLSLALAAGPLYFCWDANRILKQRGVHTSGRRPGAFSHNLLFSLLSFGAGGIAVVTPAPTSMLQHGAMLLVLLLFITRTHLLYREHLREQESLRQTTLELERKANEDPKTGIGNRKWLAETFDTLAPLPRNFPVALLLVDINGFGRVNEDFNYGVGDMVLRSVAARLRQFSAKHPRAVCSRLRGDEFALLLPRCSADSLQEMTERLRDAIHAIPFDFGYRASVSIGVAIAEHGVTLPHLLEDADEALFANRSRALEPAS